MAVGLLLLAIAAVLVTVQSALAGTGGGPLTTTGAAAGSMSPAAAQLYVVRPGDTLWSIARSVEPNSDVRPLVDRLDAELRGATVYPGEPIYIPRAG